MTHLLRSLIRQIQLESNRSYKPEAPADSPLGKYAFANVRAGEPKPPYEEDTKTEIYLYQKLISHFRSDLPLKKFETDQILDFIEKDLYSDVFRAPGAGVTLYRGLNFKHYDRRIAEKFLPKGITFVDVMQQIAETGEEFSSFKTQLDLTNKNEDYTASWTKSLYRAADFAAGEHSDFRIVLCATVEDNPGKWIDCSGLYGLIDIAHLRNEREVIAAGTIRVNEVMFMSSSSVEHEVMLTKIENLPKNLRIVKGDLDFTYIPITSLPAGLQVGGHLRLRGTSITSLPDDLKVGGNLYLLGSSITSLPTDLQVGGGIYDLDRKYWASVPQHLKDKLR